MTPPNIPLLRKVVEWVEEQEARTENREWLQGYWFTDTSTVSELTGGWCATAYCVAGKVAFDAGWKPVWERLTDGARDARCVARDGEALPVREVAAELFGIGEIDASRLFRSDNSASDIRQIAEDIAGERL